MLFEENAAILRNMEADGCDLGPSRQIDFSHAFPSQETAKAFAQEAEHEGFVISIEMVEGDEDPWDVTASKEMIPTCESITRIEEHLGALARSHQGRADGWGFFRF